MVSSDLAAETLGINRGASDAEIRRAYKNLAQQNHPDHGGDPSVMANINEAYQHLIGQDVAPPATDGDIDWEDLDVDEPFETWEEMAWPEPPGFRGLWRSLLAVVILPVALFAIVVLTVVLLRNYVN